ncbi:MAG: GldG family protein, partial [Oscillospiraceae bacterium]|nr:GldG family protein [Oscillospiraceae bacterium]
MARGGDAGEKNRRWGLKLPRPQNVGARAVKVGGYTTLLGVILVFVAIALNLFVSELPPQFIKFDTSAQKLYTISPQTREVIGKLEQDVILYYISEPSTYDLLIQEMLERYSSLSDRISVQYVNSILYPNFASQYKSGTIYPNSVVVKIGDKSRWVGYEQIFDVIYYTDYSNSNIQYDTVFQGESALTNAISFLVSGNMPVVYNLSGHGEPEMNPDFMSFIERQNIELRDLSLIGGGAVPNDAD